MMNYENFKNYLKENFLSYLPERFQDGKIIIDTTMRNNEILTSLTVNTGKGVSPIIYIEDMYECYCAVGLELTMKKYSNIYVEASKDNFSNNITADDFFNNYLKPENLICNVINAENNKEFLKTVIHRRFNDLAVIYRVVVEKC